MTNTYSPDTILRHRALALRDLTELLDVDEVTATVDNVTLTYSADDGFHLLTGDETTDITDWVDRPGLVPA